MLMMILQTHIGTYFDSNTSIFCVARLIPNRYRCCIFDAVRTEVLVSADLCVWSTTQHRQDEEHIDRCHLGGGAGASCQLSRKSFGFESI